MVDPIADMLTRIRNAGARKHEVVDVPKSKLKLAMLRILKDQNFIVDYKVVGAMPHESIRIVLKYIEGTFAISGLKRVSTPGRRIYVKRDDILPIKRGMGIAILSTSKGLLTDKQSKRLGVAGEMLCHIW